MTCFTKHIPDGAQRHMFLLYTSRSQGNLGLVWLPTVVSMFYKSAKSVQCVKNVSFANGLEKIKNPHAGEWDLPFIDIVYKNQFNELSYYLIFQRFFKNWRRRGWGNGTEVYSTWWYLLKEPGSGFPALSWPFTSICNFWAGEWGPLLAFTACIRCTDMNAAQTLIHVK